MAHDLRHSRPGEQPPLAPSPQDEPLTAPTPGTPRSPCAAPEAKRHLPSASGPLPRYLFRRGRMLYYKRKVPADVLDGFPEQQGGQV